MMNNVLTKKLAIATQSLIFCLFLIAFTGCTTTPMNDNVGVKVSETESFNEIAEVITALNNKYGANNVLIVSDIDNTLLTSVSDLGGDIWYLWQDGRLNVKPTPEQKVSCLYQDDIGMLYELAPMTLTEPQVSELLSQWQNAGNTVMLLTSRAPKYRSPTERELARHGIDVTNSLSPKNEPNPVYREMLKRELSYSKGIMMTTGMNKGDMLHWILDKTGQQFAAIVFIDDSHKNIVNMQNAWQNNNVDMHIFYYTHIEADRIEEFGAVLTQDQADKMAADYEKLQTVLQEIFPARPTDSCLSLN